MSTYSPNLRLNLIASGAEAGTWGNTTNYNLGTLLESAISGKATVSVTTTSQVLTANNGVSDESRDAILQLNNGGVAAAFSVFAPPVSKIYAIFNNTAYDATIYNSTTLGSTVAAGAGAVVKAGVKAFVFSDITNFYNVASSGVLTVPNGGTGVSTLTGLAYGNGTSAFTAATAAQIVAAISTTAVANATNAVAAGSLTTTNFSIVQSGGKLYFKYGATNIASLDSSGNLIVLANVTGYGTP